MGEIRKVTFIGSGKVTYFLIEALKRKEKLPEKVSIYDPDDSAVQKVIQIDETKIERVDSFQSQIDANIVFLAVHPPVIEKVSRIIVGKLDNVDALVSFAPSVSISRLKSYLSGFHQIVRMIPNAPSLIGEGYNPVAFSDSFDVNIKNEILEFFVNWGKCPEVKEENLEAYAILSGMGPTYFWFQLLKLKDLALKFGLSENEAEDALVSVVKGSIDVLFESGLSSEDVLNLIPVHPLKRFEDSIRSYYEERLIEVHNKIKY